MRKFTFAGRGFAALFALALLGVQARACNFVASAVAVCPSVAVVPQVQIVQPFVPTFQTFAAVPAFQTFAVQPAFSVGFNSFGFNSFGFQRSVFRSNFGVGFRASAFAVAPVRGRAVSRTVVRQRVRGW
jgi:hypothetical protein